MGNLGNIEQEQHYINQMNQAYEEAARVNQAEYKWIQTGFYTGKWVKRDSKQNKDE